MIESVLLTASDDGDTTLEEYEKYLIYNYGYRDSTLESILEEDDYCKDQYDKCKNLLESGYNILVKSVDHNDSYCSSVIDQLSKDNENFVIVSGE